MLRCCSFPQKVPRCAQCTFWGPRDRRISAATKSSRIFIRFAFRVGASARASWSGCPAPRRSKLRVAQYQAKPDTAQASLLLLFARGLTRCLSAASPIESPQGFQSQKVPRCAQCTFWGPRKRRISAATKSSRIFIRFAFRVDASARASWSGAPAPSSASTSA